METIAINVYHVSLLLAAILFFLLVFIIAWGAYTFGVYIPRMNEAEITDKDRENYDTFVQPAERADLPIGEWKPVRYAHFYWTSRYDGNLSFRSWLNQLKRKNPALMQKLLDSNYKIDGR